MKTLLLVRHAKSSWGDESIADFDRPLAPRGIEAAPLVGGMIEREGWLPDLALVSPARRTRQTWDLFAASWKKECPVAFEPALYEAEWKTILDLVGRTAEEVSALLVLGHNPGLEQLARGLAGPDSDAHALAQLDQKFPTAAVARLEIEGSWRDARPHRARLTHFVRPRDLTGSRSG